MDWPILGGTLDRFIGSPSLSYVNPSFNSTAHVKSSWSEVIASTPYDGSLSLSPAVVAWATGFLFDIGIGGAGSEVAILENVLADQCANYCNDHYRFPIIIPGGTRVSFRGQQARGGTNSVWVQFFISRVNSLIGGANLFQRSFSYGYNLSDSGGTQIDPGAVAWTWGSWTEISASISKIKAFSLLIANPDNVARSTNATWLLQVAIGAAGQEQIIAEWSVYNRSGLVIRPVMSPLLNIQIPSGTRISVRAQSEVTATPNRYIDAMIVGYA